MKFIRTFLILALPFLMTVPLPAQSDDDSDSTAAAMFLSNEFQTVRRIRFGVSMVQMNSPYYIAVQNALKRSVTSLGATMVLANARNDAITQIRDIESMLEQGIDILIVLPADAHAIRPAIEKARHAGVVVISLDIKAEGPINAFVGTKNYDAGFKSGDFLLSAINEDDKLGEVAIVTTSDNPNCRERIRGFMSALNNYPRLRLVEICDDINDGLQAKQATLDLIARHPGISAIFAINDPLALGVYQAASEIRQNLKITSIDGIPEVVKLVASGNNQLIATVAQSPTDQAYAAVGLSLMKYWGADIQSEFMTDIKLLDFYNSTGFTW